MGVSVKDPYLKVSCSPTTQVKMMGEMGLMGIEIGKQVRLKSALPVRFEMCLQYGGAGKDALSYAIAMEEIRLKFVFGNSLRRCNYIQSWLCGHWDHHDCPQQHLHGTNQGTI